ncbi:MAG TPA: FtsX-like permease family protein [Candidatus Lumbricidophila sp.]|nr:FtsX-like permease family protein [Candidatus Lumbricidophila sp.]
MSLGPAALFFTAGALAAVALTIVYSVTGQEGQAALREAPEGSGAVVAQIGLFMMVLGIGVPMIFVTSAVAGTSVELDRQLIATWRLAGAAPSHVRLIVLARLLLVALVSSALGTAVSPMLAQPALDFLLQVTTINIPIGAHSSPGPIALAVGAVATLAVLGGLAPASRASRIPPLEAIRAAQDRNGRSVGRHILGGVAVAVAISIAISTAGQPNPGPASTTALVAMFAAAAALSVLAPVCLGPLLSLWTRIVPPSAWPAWWLARIKATQRLSATSSTVAPLATVLIVMGGYFSLSRTWEQATGESGQADVNTQQGLVLFAPGAVIALVGAATVLFSVVGYSQREQRQLRTVGASPANLVLASLIEPLLYVGTALLASVPIVYGITLSYTVALNQAGLHATPTVHVEALAAAGLAGYLVTALATAPSAAAGLVRARTANAG